MVPVVVLSKVCLLFIMFIIRLHHSAGETTIHQLAEQEDTTEKYRVISLSSINDTINENSIKTSLNYHLQLL